MSFRDGFRIKGVTARKATGKALLCAIPDVGEVWVPQSQIHDDSEVYEAEHEGDLVVSTWWAEKQGWL